MVKKKNGNKLKEVLGLLVKCNIKVFTFFLLTVR